MTTRPGLTLNHIGLYAHDLNKLEDFYTRVLGFTVTDRGDLPIPGGSVTLVFLSRDPEDHHQIALASGRPAQIPYNIVNQISLKADSLTTLKKLLVNLKKEGITDINTISHGNALSMYVHDPEGNRLELFMDLPWYVTQPMREPMDLTLSENEIFANAEKHARAQPGFMLRTAWRAKMVERMGMA
jgi:catechol-2,3-dioxygenase